MRCDQVPNLIAEQDFDDHDSAVDSASVYTDTTSLSSSVTKYREENGRRYHAYGMMRQALEHVLEATRHC